MESMVPVCDKRYHIYTIDFAIFGRRLRNCGTIHNDPPETHIHLSKHL